MGAALWQAWAEGKVSKAESEWDTACVRIAGAEQFKAQGQRDLRVKRLFWLIFAGLMTPFLALTDELQPFYIELVAAPRGTFTLDTQAAPGQDRQTATLMPPCTRISNDQRGASGTSSQPTVYRCNDLSKDLVIQRTSEGLSPPALIRFKRLSGQIDLYYLKAGAHQQTLNAIAPNQGSFGQYLTLGFDHILMGYDHLLFVLCLVLLASSLRRVLVMVTGFTLAHSMTLGLAALGVLRAPIALIELLIAVSVLLLAVELAKRASANPHASISHPRVIVLWIASWTWLCRSPHANWATRYRRRLGIARV